MKNLIEETIKNNIKDNRCRFVFPTQMAADLWADRATLTCGVSAVAMERFVAWDDFKGNSVKSKKQDRESIPSVMRTVFATLLLEDNKKSTFIKKIIGPEYAKEAGGFTKWITSLLPSLSLWKKHIDGKKIELDDEDKDLLEIYRRYCDFLDSNNFFDPAWEVPPFESDGNHYFIFFPEILSDYSEYSEILETTDDVTQIHVTPEMLPSIGNTELLPSASFFADSRSELKNLALTIRKIHEEKNIDWQDMAISVPDMDSYGRYIERELNLYRIPHVIRFARPLDSTGAGNFFAQAMECVNSNFTFDSVRDLLLNLELPWNDKESINQLIEFGKNNNCICSYTYDGKDIDVWKESFKTVAGETRAKGYYDSLRKHLKALVGAKSFSDIRDEYFQFRNFAFDMKKCSPSTDRIISRCISELGALIDIEKKYGQYTLPSPYSFFIEQLSDTKYLEQADNLGVRVLPYKTAACAPFEYHAIIDASQNSLSVVYKPLSFLREDKRRKIFCNREDPNATQHFVSLYKMNSLSEPCYFSAASKTFTGYAQVCSYLNEKEIKGADVPKGFYDLEKEWIMGGTQGNAPDSITSVSRDGFQFWKKCQNLSEAKDEVLSSKISEKIRDAFCKNEGKVKISASSLKKFYSCPRVWLENYIAGLKEPINEATLIDKFAQGKLYHKVMELFLSALKEKNMLILHTDEGLREDYLDILMQAIDSAIEAETRTPVNSDGNSFLATELINATKNQLKQTMVSVVTAFSRQFNGYSVLYTEKELSYADPEMDYILHGYADLIISDGTEEMLIDFKTGKTPEPLYEDGSIAIKNDDEDDEDEDENMDDDSDEDMMNLPDFQMPAYLYLLEKKENLKVENAAFFSIKKQEIVPVVGKAAFDIFFSIHPKTKKEVYTRDTFQPTIDLFLQKAQEFADRIRNNDFQVNNADQNFEKCNECTFRALCRRVFNVSRKE